MVAAVVAAAALTCRPEPRLGSVALLRRGALHVVDLATCRERVLRRGATGRPAFERSGRAVVLPPQAPLTAANGRVSATVRASGKGRSAKQTIWLRDARTGAARRVFSETQWYRTIGPGDTPGPILLLGVSGDGRWVFFAIDPGGSGSIAADGLTLRVVSADGGRAYRLGRMLPYPDYLTWCGGRLVFTAGGNRVATSGKRLLVASPPTWRPRPLAHAPGRAWGSVACAAGGRAVIAQSQRSSANPSFFAAHWQLWRVARDASLRRLTTPPRGAADESPRLSRDGRTLLFVRSRRGVGKLYALRPGRVTGPLLSLGYDSGYYGHDDWWHNGAWSEAAG